MYFTSVIEQNRIRRITREYTASEITYTPTDDFQSRASVHIAKARTWAGPTHKLMLGEFGIPNNVSDQSSYNDLAAFVLQRCACENISWTVWATGHHWGTTYNVAFYEKNGGTWGTETNAAPLETHYADAVPFTGINYAGHEFFDGSTAPTEADLDYLYTRGIRTIRYPVGPAFIYPTANGSLNTTNLNHLRDTLNNAALAGINVILDVLHPGSGGDYAKLFGVALTDATTYGYYEDYVTKLMNATITDHTPASISLKNHAALYAVDIANEPANVTPAQWETISQDIYDHFRQSIGYTGTLMIPIGSYSGVHSIDSYHPSGPWITPYLSDTNYVYEFHYYPNKIAKYGDWDGTFWYEPVVNSERSTRAFSSKQDGGADDNAFALDDHTTYWQANSPSNEHIGWDFGSTVRPYKYMVANDGTNSPTAWVLESSDDNSNWTTRHTVASAGSFSGDNFKYYDITPANGRYWRVRVTGDNGTAVRISEIKFEAVSEYALEVASASTFSGQGSFTCSI